MSDEHTSTALRTRVTQKDVAERAGVAVSVVSYVLNNAPRPVAPATRERVLRAIDELGYRPNEHARRLIQQNWGGEARPRQFGIVMSDSHTMISRPFYTTMLAGILAEAARQSYSLRFIHLYDSLRNPIIFNEEIQRDRLAGVIVFHYQIGVERERDLIEKLVERIDNVICLDFHWAGLPSILFDQRNAGRIATDHLVALGHRRIAFLGNRDNRFDGYLDSLRYHGIPFDSALATGDGGNNSPEDGYQAALRVLAWPQRPSAVLGANDEVALGALGAAHQQGVRVPDDLSIVGVDDNEMARFASPPLTTVSVPKTEMAALALRTLIDRRDKPDEMPLHMVFPVKLVQRTSTAPHRA
jgi:DNA-binding LacI/PurR family transcriptional regulator